MAATLLIIQPGRKAKALACLLFQMWIFSLLVCVYVFVFVFFNLFMCLFLFQ